MPLPTPRKNEKKNDFISRCMSEAKGEFPNRNQRVAVCHTQWRRKNKSIDERLDELKEGP